MRRTVVALAVTPLLVVLGDLHGATGALAAPAKGAIVTLDRTTVQLGQRVVVSLSGWSAHNVTISVCGNLAQRGSGDCNLAASQALTLNGSASTVTELTVFAPPGTCPCVIRASSDAQGEVAVAPIEIVGVPVGPVVGAVFRAPLAASVRVRREHVGLVAAVRSALGGPTTYVVTVSFVNQIGETLKGVTATGSVGRAANEIVASFDVPPPGDLVPGQTWEHSERVTVPAPVINRVFWRVSVSGAGAPADAEAVTHGRPLGFVLLVVLFVVDVIAMAVYFTARRIRRRRSLDPVDAAEIASELDELFMAGRPLEQVV